MRAFAGTAAVASLLALSLANAGAHPLTDVTWHGEIAGVLQRRCAGCHRPGGIGPVDLTDYSESRQWGHAIKRAVLDRRMPPWQAAPGFGDFSNDRSITPYEVAMLVAWINGGMRVGDPGNSPPRVTTAPRLGQPNLVVVSPVPYRVSGPWHTFQTRSDLAQDASITAWEFSPGNLALVDQAKFFVGDTLFGTWTPAEPATVLPNGTGQPLPRGAPIRVEVHYRQTRDVVTDQSSLALRVTTDAVRPVRRARLHIGQRVISAGMELIAVRPTLCNAGDSAQIIARRPDGAPEVLLVLTNYDPKFPVTYRFRKTVLLPPGTLVDVSSYERECRMALDFVRPAVSLRSDGNGKAND
jgi:hypothetical protein